MAKRIVDMPKLLLLIALVCLLGCNDNNGGETIGSWDVPQHPYMSDNGKSNVHNDAYMTDSYTISGPEGDSLKINSLSISKLFITIAFDEQGRIMTLGTGSDGKRVAYLISPDSLTVISSFDLPASTDADLAG